jgi:hypothetical protein
MAGRCASATSEVGKDLHPRRRRRAVRSDLQPGVLEVELARQAAQDLVVDPAAVAELDQGLALCVEDLPDHALICLGASLVGDSVAVDAAVAVAIG